MTKSHLVSASAAHVVWLTCELWAASTQQPLQLMDWRELKYWRLSDTRSDSIKRAVNNAISRRPEFSAPVSILQQSALGVSLNPTPGTTRERSGGSAAVVRGGSKVGFTVDSWDEFQPFETTFVSNVQAFPHVISDSWLCVIRGYSEFVSDSDSAKIQDRNMVYFVCLNLCYIDMLFSGNQDYSDLLSVLVYVSCIFFFFLLLYLFFCSFLFVCMVNNDEYTCIKPFKL